MSDVTRIYVEKREGFTLAADALLMDLRQNLGVSPTALRIIGCYDIEGLSEADLRACRNIVFFDPASENIIEGINAGSAAVFGRRLLPGQYDQGADSAAQCVQIITGVMPRIVCTRYYVIDGITEDERAKIVDYCINPIESMEVGSEIPHTLEIQAPPPSSVPSLSITGKTDDELKALHKELGLSMSADDLAFCQKYFSNEGREPTITEIRMLDTYWSDHCRHTTFLTKIESVDFEDGVYRELFESAYKAYLHGRSLVYGETDRPITLMDMATIGMKIMRKQGRLDDLDQSEEINAASIIIPVDVDGKTEDWLLMFKNETHNHPTEMEPFGGAATCLGGAIRDPLSGRAYVYQAMRITGSADPRKPISKTLPGKLPQKKITTIAADGYSSYGNQIGLATGLVQEIYHESYIAKRMELGAVIAAAPKSHVVRKRPASGDLVILAGGRTGRDGIGGATGSSKELTEESLQTCGAEVQKGNAPTERKLQRLFRNPDAARLILRCNDFGAGGVSVAIGELADSLEINLDEILKKYDGLDGTELAISESQERMAVVVHADDAQAFIGLANDEGLEAVIVARVTDSGRLIMRWRGDEIVNVTREFLDTAGVAQSAKIIVSGDEVLPEQPEHDDLQAAWLENLAQLNVAAQKGLVEMFDSTVGAATMLSPFGGKHQLTPALAMSAKIPVYPYFGRETETVSFMAPGFNPEISAASPFHGAAFAVIESIARAVASGADYRKLRLTFQEYFERLGDDAKRWGKPFAALLGANWAQMKLGIPSIGGKDSMSGSFKDIDVVPTLVSFAVGVGKAANVVSPEFKQIGSDIVLVRTPADKNGLPDFEILAANFDAIHKLITQGLVKAAHIVGFGGLAAACSKMSFGNKIGAVLNYDGGWFTPDYGAMVLEIEAFDAVKSVFADCICLGKTQSKPAISANGLEMAVDKALEAWLAPMDSIFKSGLLSSPISDDCTIPLYAAKNVIVAKNRIAQPKVLIPVFPGSNCEWDIARQFEAAGATAELFIINNLNIGRLNESIQAMPKLLGQSHILAIPGGFSAGDEPGGSGKFIAAYFRNARLTEAIHEMLSRRDGLILGVCNGFQALIKLGLVPYGEITDITANSPTLHNNSIGRHVSNLVQVKIISNKSPWMALSNPGDVYRLPASHGEGRFMASPELVAELAKNGQIASQYVDALGEPTMATPFNPNGSKYAIEGITSPDGRILGRMCHSERVGGLYRNVPGDYEDRIFVAGVKYFQ